MKKEEEMCRCHYPQRPKSECRLWKYDETIWDGSNRKASEYDTLYFGHPSAIKPNY